jgi:hypothetical protein
MKTKDCCLKIYRVREQHDDNVYNNILQGRIKIGSVLRLPVTNKENIKPVRIKQKQELEDDQNKKYEFKKMMQYYKVFTNEKKKKYSNDYLSEVFRLLKTRDKNYPQKRKLLNLDDKITYNSPRQIKNNLYLTTIPIKNIDIKNTLITESDWNFNMPVNNMNNRYEKEVKTTIDSFENVSFLDDEEFNKDAIIKKLRRNHDFYQDKRSLSGAKILTKNTYNNNTISTSVFKNEKNVVTHGKKNIGFPSEIKKILPIQHNYLKYSHNNFLKNRNTNVNTVDQSETNYKSNAKFHTTFETMKKKVNSFFMSSSYYKNSK